MCLLYRLAFRNYIIRLHRYHFSLHLIGRQFSFLCAHVYWSTKLNISLLLLL